MEPGLRPMCARGGRFALASRPPVATSIGLALLATLFAATQPAGAQSRSGTLGVSAVVVASTRAEVLSQASTLVVTDADVRRGYVEVAAASRLAITSTSRAGYRVHLHPRLALFRSVDIHVAGLRARIGPDGGSLVAAGRHGRRVPVDVDYRFELAEGIAPGHYPWPVVLDAQPL